MLIGMAMSVSVPSSKWFTGALPNIMSQYVLLLAHVSKETKIYFNICMISFIGMVCCSKPFTNILREGNVII